MALPINIEDLLHKQRVESNRIEFKEDGTQRPSIIASVRLPMTLTISAVDI